MAVCFLPFFVFAGKELVLVVQAVQFAVKQVDLLRRFESYTLECILIGRDDPRRCTGELMLECCADIGIQVHDVLILPNALAIRRIDHDQRAAGYWLLTIGCWLLAIGCWLLVVEFDLFHADLANVHILLHAGRADVLQGGLHGVIACIGGIDMMGELALVGIIRHQCIKQIFVEIFPVLECKMLAKQSGRDIQRYQCRLNSYRT